MHQRSLQPRLEPVFLSVWRTVSGEMPSTTSSSTSRSASSRSVQRAWPGGGVGAGQATSARLRRPVEFAGRRSTRGRRARWRPALPAQTGCAPAPPCAADPDRGGDLGVGEARAGHPGVGVEQDPGARWAKVDPPLTPNQPPELGAVRRPSRLTRSAAYSWSPPDGCARDRPPLIPRESRANKATHAWTDYSG